MTVLEVLNWATNYLTEHGVENPRLNAELLLARSMDLRKEGIYIHLQNQLPEEKKEILEALVNRRISGEPLQYILGQQEFWSIDMKVDPRVLIPRPETELLVEQALSVLSQKPPGGRLVVLEIGTGSGAISVSLAKERKDIFLIATDISKDALTVAKENAMSTDVADRIAFVNGDLFSPFGLYKGGPPFDLVLSNPPYISRRVIEGLGKEVKDHEPRAALDGGEDGLFFYRKIIPRVSNYLLSGGWLLLEVGQGESTDVSEIIEKEGNFKNVERVIDFSGIERVVKAQKK
jgi:release factor glutamine methyltransferase